MDLRDIFSLTLSGAALIVSVVTFALNFHHNRKSAKLARKPVLVFDYSGDDGWTLRNVGAGPALNIIVAQKRIKGEWFNPVRIPPLSKDGKMVLTWLNHVNDTGLGAVYSDAEELPYTSTCANDLSQASPGTQFGPWPESKIGRHWNHSPYSSTAA